MEEVNEIEQVQVNEEGNRVMVSEYEMLERVELLCSDSVLVNQ